MDDEKEIRISKETLDELSEDFEETSLGDPMGARRQFRSKEDGAHVREYDDNFTVHIDRADPRKRPLQHLLLDSPETLGALFCANLLSHREERASDSRTNPLGFLASFLFLNYLFRDLKRILRFLFF